MSVRPESDHEWKEVYRSEEVAARYARKRAGSRTSVARDRREQAIVARALDRARLAPGARALDVPTGTGRFLPTLRARGFHVVAADIASPMLRRAREGVEPGSAAFLLADAERLPFRDEAFDLVLVVRLLHHAPSPDARRRLLAEIARVARSGGYVVVSFFHAISFHELRDRALAAIRPFRKSRHAVTLRALAQEARAAGLALVSAHPELRYIKRNWFALFRRER